MKSLFFLSLFLSAALAVTASTAFFIFIEGQTAPLGFQSLDYEEASTRIAVVSLSSVLGVVSKITYDAMTRPYRYSRSFRQSLKSALRTGVIAFLVTPIVLSGIYGLLKEVEDLFLLFLIAYQNGFFFQTILGRAEIAEAQGRLL